MPDIYIYIDSSAQPCPKPNTLTFFFGLDFLQGSCVWQAILSRDLAETVEQRVQ